MKLFHGAATEGLVFNISTLLVDIFQNRSLYSQYDIWDQI